MSTPDRPLDVFLPAASPYELLARRFRGEPSTWLPNAHPAGPDCWRIEVAAGRFIRPVDCCVEPIRHGQQSIWRHVSWAPAASAVGPVPVERMLPTLHAELGVVKHRDGATMVLSGTYRVPAGFLGVLADATGLHRVARTSARDFLDSVHRRLAARTARTSG